MAKKESRCWPGYEPVKGKQQHEQGSCRPKAKSKLTATQKQFRNNRTKQLAEWKEEHPGSPTKAAQHLHKPGIDTKRTTKKTPVKKRTVAKKKSAAKR